jgi:hypothetical protein
MAAREIAAAMIVFFMVSLLLSRLPRLPENSAATELFHWFLGGVEVVAFQRLKRPPWS